MTPAASARAVVTAARKWAKARATARKLTENSRARKADVAKNKRDVIKSAEALERAVAGFEKLFASARTLRKAGVKVERKERVKIPWAQVFKGVEAVAGAAAKAARARGRSPDIIEAEIIE
ncbi:MAG: hypothetical protein GY772_29265 [bacterium]|nr:hypothetical protein [bacterium]